MIYRLMLTRVSGPLEVSRLTPQQFCELMFPGHRDKPTIRRNRATFLPGVNPKWEEREALKTKNRSEGKKGVKWRRVVAEVFYEYLDDGTVVEHRY